MKLAPIVIFTYNRPWHTQQTVEALLKNEYASESDLIIFSDAPKNEAAKKGWKKLVPIFEILQDLNRCVLLSEIGILVWLIILLMVSLPLSMSLEG